MKRKSLSFEELRKQSIEGGLNLVDVYLKGTSEVEIPEISKQRDLPDDPKEAIKVTTLDALDEFRGVREQVSLEDLITRVSIDAGKEGISLAIDTPLAGYVSHVLFQYAEQVKYKKKHPEWGDRRSDPIFTMELKSLLGVNFTHQSIHQIAGNLSGGYVHVNYGINKQYEIVDKNGNPCSVEGERRWNGVEKNEARQQLLKLIGQLLEELRSDHESEIAALKKVRGELEEELERYNDPVKDANSAYSISATSNEFLVAFRREFVDRLTGGETTTRVSIRDGMVVYNEFRATYIFFQNKSAERNFMDRYSKFKNHRGGYASSDIRISKISTEDPTYGEISDRIRQHGPKPDDLLEKRLEFASGMIRTLEEIPPQVNYMGLEGPTFGSYLQILKLIRQRGVSISSFLPEYFFRISHLMKSVANAFENEFSDVNIEFADIDNLILIDFASSNELWYDSKDDTIKFRNESLRWPSYSALASQGLDIRSNVNRLMVDLDARMTHQHLASKYGMSTEFIEALENKSPSGLFDIVFLDYVGAITSRREKALEVLVGGRLADKAVLAVTLNRNPRYTPKDAKRTSSEVFDFVWSLLEKHGYDVKEVEHRDYNDGGTPVSFVGFYVNKRTPVNNSSPQNSAA